MPRAGGLADRTIADLPDLLQPGDALIVNETRVIRARLRGTREPGGGAAELLLVRPAGGGPFRAEAERWTALARPGRKLGPGTAVRFGDDARAVVEAVEPDGTRRVRFEGALPVAEVLERYGELPLPPYVGPGDAARAERYQTVFARVPGSVAAPTASLHFTAPLLAAIRARGVTIAALTLDVGLGTFRPMDGASIDAHAMHAERYVISDAVTAAVAAARARGGRVVAAGTTVLRALEAAAAADGAVRAGEGETRLFVTPGFRFRAVDALLTNFHLPASTLLVLVAAFAGHARTMRAYAHAIDAGYRFFSFGDASFVERAAP